jgi:hypothetical protein
MLIACGFQDFNQCRVKHNTSAFFTYVSSKTPNSVHFPFKLLILWWRTYSLIQVLSFLFLPFLFNLYFFPVVLTIKNCPYSLVAFGSFVMFLPLAVLVWNRFFFGPLFFLVHALWTKKHVLFRVVDYFNVSRIPSQGITVLVNCSLEQEFWNM